MLIWFSKRIDLYAVLDDWRNEGSNYQSDQAIDNSWYVDGFEVVLGTSDEQRLFDTAVKRLFRYNFYPDSVLKCAANFIHDDRPPEIGDRIVQRIRIIPGILDAVTMNIVKSVWHEPDRRGFTMVTSERQYEMGEWTASISRKPSGTVALVVRVVSKPSNRLPAIAGGFSRRLQKRAHRLALQSFSSAVRES
jgi:uncharacterized protein (UPF0548 family)